ncbi:hypothetical protein SCHPADRAFT_275542 [Schizopora paradoxa]|uniref:DUF6533 domain-containing protein n=1 Tax=Schizopora paradoxa TaxID=27342 RepID=A0A0H2S0J4_9AGAM|nr:hypothetical protein SCHPADRAFT_275542 [Schizopora paradoxa]
MSALPGNFLEQDARFLQIFHYTLVASVALLVYDYLLTLREEVRFMWMRRMTFGKMLFFLNRYLPFATGFFSIYSYTLTLHTGFTACRNYHIAASALAYFSFVVSLAVLFTRTYAVWGASKVINNSLIAIFVCFVGTTSYGLSVYVRGATPVQLSDLPFAAFHRGCVIFFANDLIWIDCVVLAVMETLAVGLLIAKSFMNRNHGHSQSNSRLLDVMVRDGVGYYVCNIAITTASVVVLRRSSPFLRDFMLITQGILENIMCTRLLLHVYVVHDAQMRGMSSTEGTLVELRALPKWNPHSSSKEHTISV